MYHKQFKKRIIKQRVKVQDKFLNLIHVFTESKKRKIFLKELNQHELCGSMKGVYSIDITGDIRALYIEECKGVTFFIDIGTHAELYG